MKECKYKDLCGGCQLQGFSYRKQLDIKQEKIEKLLSKFCRVNNIIGMDDPLHYRNKIQVSFAKDEKGNVLCGNYIPSTHHIVEIDDCMISDELSLDIIKSFKKLIIKYKVSIFNENTYKGTIRHLQIRCTNTNEYMLIIVTGTNRINNIDLIIKELLKNYKCIKTIIQNINRKHTSMVLGDKNHTLYGKGFISDYLCSNKYSLSASSFYQVNKRQTEILYNKAIQLADLKGNENCIDAYCGIGTITLTLALKVKNVIGVELNKQAIKDAIYNAKLNKVNNVKFICDDAGRFMQNQSKTNKKIDVVVMDPPRSGASDKFLNALVKLSPNKIIYISCGPESLRNNLKYLIKNSYKVDTIQPIDMFPMTEHVETMVLISKKSCENY